MTRPSVLAAPLLFLACVCAAQPGPKPNPRPVWTVGLEAPMSAQYDAKTAAIYVSTGRGVAKLDARGKLVKKYWAVGLQSPRGLRACGGKLLVADGDALAELSTSSGALVARLPLRDAKALEGVATDAACNAYLSDPRTKRVYRVGADRTISIVAEGPALAAPAGLALEGGALVVAGERMFRLDLASKKVTAAPGPMGSLAGLLRWKGEWLVSDGATGTVMRVAPNGATVVWLNGLQGAGDLGLVPARTEPKARALLLVPRARDNRLDAYAL